MAASAAVLFRAAAGSDIGRRYRTNYDVVHLAVVADGMGDGEGSTRAGRAAVAALVRHADAAALDRAALGPTALGPYHRLLAVLGADTTAVVVTVLDGTTG
ncbi:hypothetical protein JOF53_005956 [Crossiella equi]|uniref:Protein phosphatase n=1 Tax=Crossiella equi TaxID=130796 RepID=A0ABS5ALI9_9PSEU|nr:hypothetical protein [Crossiella equi]